MSRIFDALQRSGTEQSGVEYPDMVSVATAFEGPQRPDSAHAAVSAEAAAKAHAAELFEREIGMPSLQPTDAEPAESILSKEAADLTAQFPSLAVHLGPSSRLVYFTEPDSLAAEKFRFLGVRLRQLKQARELKKVLVTSTIPEEGKSLVSANLAGVLARRKQRVLLIEGDMRRPTLAQQFGLGKLAGLAEWLQGAEQNPANIYRLEGPGLWLMPAGSPPANTLELMQSGRLSQLMKQLGTMFDWIVVDSPPLLPLADTTVWARLTDGTLLVAREGKSEKKQLQRGLEALKKSDLLGVVLNGCQRSDNKNYYQRYGPVTR